MNERATDDKTTVSPLRTLVKGVGFMTAVVLSYALIGNILPQVVHEVPQFPDEDGLDLGSLTMESFIARGEEIFTNPQKCVLCHNDLGRAPNIPVQNMVETGEQRLADPRYGTPAGGNAEQAKATTSEEYLRESITTPNAYVVTGFGTKGSNDTVSPMPDAMRPPLSLSAVDVEAVIAYLQAKDGNEVTVALPTALPEKEEGATTVAAAPALATTPEEVIEKFACRMCHIVAGSGGEVGPNLSAVGTRRNVESIRKKILDPTSSVVDGFPAGVMPPDFGNRMTAKELDMLAKFLAKQKG